VPARQPRRIGALQVRTIGDPQVIEPAIRETIRAINPRLFQGITTIGEVSNKSIAKERMVAVVSGFFGLLGLSLACMGIFGVATGAVARRTKELGIRRALGAGTWSVIGECLRETFVVTTVGIVVGAIAAIVAVRVSATYVADLLFGITATDIANVAVAIVLMAVIALVACALPAVRATRIDPLTVLREE